MSQSTNETQSALPFEEDFQFAQRVLRQDPAACRQFYDRYAPMLLRRLHRLTGHEQDAEDGLQQVLLEALRSLSNYRGEGPLGAWLNRIATHIAMDLLRKRHRVQSVLENTWFEKRHPTKEVPALPDELFIQEEVRMLIWKLVQRLSPLKRIVVLMSDLESRTLEDTAQELGLPLGTVISRLYQGRKELRRYLENESNRQGLSLGDWLDD